MTELPNFKLSDAVEKTKKDHAEERYENWICNHSANSTPFDKELIKWMYESIMSFDE